MAAQQVSFVLRLYQAGFPIETVQPVTLTLPFLAGLRVTVKQPDNMWFHRGDHEMRCPTIITVIYLLIATSLPLAGCATFRTLSTFDPERPMIYSGTRLDWNVTVGDESWPRKFGVEPPRYPILDLPFSFALDTVMLPATINAEIFH